MIEPYRRTELHDLAMIKWYSELCRTGDLEKVFTKSAHPLSRFFECFASPRELFFDTTKGLITFAMWFEPVMTGGALVGLWIAPDRRHHPSTYKLLITLYSKAFEVYPLLMGITKQEELLKPHLKLGYTCNGRLPGIWDGEDAWLLTLTKEDFTHGRRSNGRRENRAERAGEQLNGHTRSPVGTTV
jgi:hypothetical protein